MTQLDRRHFLAGLGAAALAPAMARAFGDHPEDLEPGNVFRHGVASGDPMGRRVVLWTRVTPKFRTPHLKVQCFVYEDAGMRRPIRKFSIWTGKWRDYTVKLDVSGLRPGTTYYYRFTALGEASPIGRTRTLAQKHPDHFRIAIASCSNYPAGFFAGYRRIAEREDLDLVLHLGDYIYEYADATFGDGSSLERTPVPNSEIVSLSDYRQRHAQYKTDPDLQEAHRQHPFVAVWDDHESTNNSWQGGAENHQPDEGDWELRKAHARRAYFEWMPIRDRRGAFERRGRIYRGFQVGDLVQLDMLDTRLFGREEQLPAVLDGLSGTLLVDPAELPEILATLNHPERQLLGRKQEEWLFKRLDRRSHSAPQWSVLGQQVMMGQLQAPIPGTPNFVPLNTDQWDGYPAARAKVLSAAAASKAENLLVLTGDIHSSWAQDLAQNPYDSAAYDPATGAGSNGVEFVTPGITSPGFPEAIAPAIAAQIRAGNPHTKYVELANRGYAVLDIDRHRARCEWYHLDDVLDPNSNERLGAVAETVSGSGHVSLVENTPMAERSDKAPAAPKELSTRRLFT